MPPRPPRPAFPAEAMITRLLWMILLLPLAQAAAAVPCGDYAERLASMRAADQALRELFKEDDPPQRIFNAVAVVDAAHMRAMKGLLKRCGWPMTSLYGQAASDDAWLLVQHADRDRKFQHTALLILEKAVARGEARGGHLAYLSDRLSVAEGRLQLYGTQFKGLEHCRLVLAPIDSREAVNRRRSAIPGMPTLEDYEAHANKAMAPSACRQAPGLD
jgi:hypothetical protein